MAWFLRFDLHLPLQMFKRAMFAWGYIVGFEYAVLTLFDIPRFAWRYVGLKEAIRVAQAASVIGIVLLIGRFVAAPYLPNWPHAQYAMVPIGVTVLNSALSFFGITGVRAARRTLVERASAQQHRHSSKEFTPTLLIGAGQAGALVVKELEKRPDLGIEPVGFLDDDRAK